MQDLRIIASRVMNLVNKAQNRKTLSATYFIEASNVGYLYKSIAPELDTMGIAGERSSISIRKTAKKLVISIKASDIPSCRAATNSWLRLVSIAADVDEVMAGRLAALP